MSTKAPSNSPTLQIDAERERIEQREKAADIGQELVEERHDTHEEIAAVVEGVERRPEKRPSAGVLGELSGDNPSLFETLTKLQLIEQELEASKTAYKKARRKPLKQLVPTDIQLITMYHELLQQRKIYGERHKKVMREVPSLRRKIKYAIIALLAVGGGGGGIVFWWKSFDR